MRALKINSNWIPALWVAAALALISLASTTSAQAQRPKPVERLGRIHGFGWGDGYHVCSESKLRLGADLPPKSFTPGHRAGGMAQPRQILHRVKTTFYDRFDALNRSCDAPGSCDDAGCDGCSPNFIVQGSQVIQGVGAVRPPQLLEPEAPHATLATGQPSQREPAVRLPNWPSEAKPEMQKPEMQSSTAVVDYPLPPVASVKKRPIRPAPPESITPRSIAIPAASKRSTIEFGPDLMGIPNSIVDANGSSQRAGDSPHSPTSTTTPGFIRPIHPDDAKSLIVRQPENSDDQQPSHAIEGERRGQISVPSYAMTPPLTLPGPPNLEKPVPTRLGSKSTVEAEFQPSKIARRPTRLGFGSVKLSPKSPRPVIEIADRAADSGENVIYQPGMRR